MEADSLVFFGEWWRPAALFAIGIAVSFINSISGGGSILSLPLLIFLGLPSAVANGTNRLGILLGTIGSMAGFRSQGMLNPRLAWQAGWPAALGALAGSLVAVRLPDRIFNPILAAIILLVVIGNLRGLGSATPRAGESARLRSGWWAFLVYAAIGFYGGFIHAGVGLIMIFAFSRMGNLNIFEINSLKVTNAFIFTVVALAAFAWAHKIHWGMAAVLAAGNFVGGWLGSHWQVKKGEAWVNRFLFWSGLAIAGKLIWDSLR